ncbi:competence protein [Muricauda sp. JGD-17]|uniref:Competence protein n=1 Tax=Flagellimonas ochracea TaxID=2696472 RepID=A0A964TEI4_9FLAO|nr:competence protein CoiA family protein [Allomuricauda ochracea]NAY93380.1 competence protein [Allomuricauda ochracea]
MRFALIDGVKVEASKGAKGFCQSCGAEMIAKCGDFKINHWAHKRKYQCDTWWETETEWHRKWKGNYPIEWQEVIQFDSDTNEKHIADIQTKKGLVIEFQHSRLNPEERRKREGFYKNMVWVVDGTRLKRDFPRFFKEWKSNGISEVRRTDKSGIFEVWFPEFCFPEAWLKSSVPVIFDFLGDGTLEDPESMRNSLYCLFPQIGKYASVAEFSRKAFLNATTNGNWTLRVQKFLNHLIEQNKIRVQKERLELERHYALNRYEFNQRLLGRKYTGGKRRL